MGKLGTKSKSQERGLKVGDHVIFKLIYKDVEALVIEDRGHIGYKGRRLLRLRVDMGEDEPMEIELPEDQVTLIDVPTG